MTNLVSLKTVQDVLTGKDVVIWQTSKDNTCCEYAGTLENVRFDEEFEGFFSIIAENRSNISIPNTSIISITHDNDSSNGSDRNTYIIEGDTYTIDIFKK